jgi:hypothetical protein
MNATTHAESPGRRWVRLSLVVAGVVLGQLILFGPSLIGSKILMPLDLLAMNNVYLPRTAQYSSVVPQDFVLSDLVFVSEFNRQFATREFRAGRLPLWTPYIYAGAPFAIFPKYSPFMLMYYLFPFPPTLACIQVMKSVLAGLGAYLFFRRLLGVGFWPAAIGAWCYPLTGFFVFWQGFDLTFVTAWFSWALLLTDGAVRRPSGWAGPKLAVLTGLVMISGTVDLAAEVLLASGMYAVWCLIDAYGRNVISGRAARAIATISCAWVLGILLSSPYLFPLIEYAQDGARLARRSAGAEDRPPAGLAALPQIVLPQIYGTTQSGSLRIVPGNLPESSAAAYTGLLAALLAAPVAWCSRRHRSYTIFSVLLGFFALAWQLNVPGLVALLRTAPLNTLSYSRFTFAASFVTLSMAVTGLEVVWQGGPEPRRWFVLPVALLVVLAGWCLYRSVRLPEPIATKIELAVQSGHPGARAPDMRSVLRIRRSFRRTYALGAALGTLGVAGWLLIWSRGESRWFPPLLGVLLVGELVWFAHGFASQADRSLYYPRIPILERLAKLPGRILGVRCLPPNLNISHGLRDVRGYDGVDPSRLIDVLDIARDKHFGSNVYAATQWYVPIMRVTASGEVRLPGVLDMLNVRYLVFRGEPPASVAPMMRQDDYWVLENQGALPRVFIPHAVETVPEGEQTLERLAAPSFDPRRVAYVDRPVALTGDGRSEHGDAEIVDELPSRVTVSLDMETAGLVVLSDLWSGGWQAYLNGRSVPVLRVNHALRGVEVPAGRGLWCSAMSRPASR